MGQGSSGPNSDHVFYIEPGPLEGRGLVTRPDPLASSVHAFVEPKQRIVLAEFEVALGGTRLDWIRVWP
jgi:hypothetical protein